MTKEEILKGIEAFQHEQTVLLRLIRRSPNGLTDDKFDSLFSDHRETIASNGDIVRTRSRPRIRVWAYARDSFILGGIHGDDWSKWLHLLQLMCEAELVKAYRENRHMVYRIL